jgi:DNA-binding NarL/FixJ family response regulator
MKRPRIALADDHTLVLDAVKNLVPSEFEVVGTFSDGRALVDAAPALKPDVVVLDIGMPKMNGLLAGEILKRAIPRVKLIFITMNVDRDLAAEAFQLGASGYLLKTSAGAELGHAIREVLRGRTYVTPSLANENEGASARTFKLQKKRHRLTARQHEILQLLAEGYTMKEIAYRLDLSPRTVAFHKYSMMTQFQIKSSAELVQFALKHSIVSA